MLTGAAYPVCDVAGPGIALIAVGLAARPVSGRRSFGFAGAEVLAR